MQLVDEALNLKLIREPPRERVGSDSVPVESPILRGHAIDTGPRFGGVLVSGLAHRHCGESLTTGPRVHDALAAHFTSP